MISLANITAERGKSDAYGYLVTAFVLFLCLVNFYQLTIRVDDEHVSFKMGIGLGKRYRLEDIKSCEPVTNSLWNGIGIRILSNGWLYNVSGLNAIELRFKDKTSVVRIGTDKPEEISQLIQSRLK